MKDAPSNVGFQSFRSHDRLELDIAKRHLTYEHAGETHSAALRSRGHLGLAAYLVAARVDGRDNGFRTDAEIMAESPGWAALASRKSARCKIWKVLEHWHEQGVSIVEAPNGATVPPWRIGLPPAQIVVVDSAELHALLRSRAELGPTHLRRNVDDPEAARALSLEDLAWVEDMIVRGGMTGRIEALARGLLDRASGSTDPGIRAESARLLSMQHRRAGRLRRALSLAQEALAYFGAEASHDPVRAAVCLNELGAIEYRQSRYELARGKFLRELALLDGQPEQAAGAARSRCLQCLALVALRAHDNGEGIRWAQAAREAAAGVGDEPAVWMARAIELRLAAHRGGVTDATDACQRLGELVRLVPATHPALVVFCRRLLVEVLYLIDDDRAADRLALAIVRDANAIGSLRDVDAVVRLLKKHGRSALAEVPQRVRAAQHDGIEDALLVEAGTCVLGRPADDGATRQRP